MIGNLHLSVASAVAAAQPLSPAASLLGGGRAEAGGHGGQGPRARGLGEQCAHLLKHAQHLRRRGKDRGGGRFRQGTKGALRTHNKPRCTGPSTRRQMAPPATPTSGAREMARPSPPPPSAKPHRMGRLEGQPDVVGALNPAPTSQYHPAGPTSGSFWYWKMAMGFLVHSAMAAMTLGLVIICARSGSPITCGGVESRNGGWKTARERKLSGRQVGRGGMGAGGVACKRGRETRGVGRAGGQGGARGSRGDVGMSRQHPPAPASAAPTHLLDKLIWLHAQGVKLGIHLQAGRQAGRGAGWAAEQGGSGVGSRAGSNR
jgi:hypothetical protein